VSTATDLPHNLDQVRRRLTAAAHRVGRPADAVTLVAVSKTVPAEIVAEAAAAGQIAFGENRVQEGLSKIETLTRRGCRGLTWHLIGPVQTNKARRAATAFDWIHSVDRIELIEKLDAAAAEAGRSPAVLIQVDLAREPTKHGAGTSAVRTLIDRTLAARALRLRGLMLIPPLPDTPEASRPWFRQLRELRDSLVADGVPASALPDLSMGMSQDFEVAVEEGATLVRVGTAIFGERHRQ